MIGLSHVRGGGGGNGTNRAASVGEMGNSIHLGRFELHWGLQSVGQRMECLLMARPPRALLEAPSATRRHKRRCLPHTRRWAVSKGGHAASVMWSTAILFRVPPAPPPGPPPLPSSKSSEPQSGGSKESTAQMGGGSTTSDLGGVRTPSSSLQVMFVDRPQTAILQSTQA